MNVEIFNKELKETNKLLFFEKDLKEYKVGKIQYLAFNKLITLLNEDTIYSSNQNIAPLKNCHIAYRIVKFTKLHNKLKLIKKDYLEPEFRDQLKFEVLPSLKERIDKLKHRIGKDKRLPFLKGWERNKFYELMKEKYQIEDIKNSLDLEIEFFHLLGNHFDIKKVNKKIDVDKYEGSFSLEAILSWENIVKLFIAEGSEEEIQVGSKILLIIQEAISINLKATFFLMKPLVEIKENDQLEMNYFKNLIHSHKSTMNPQKSLKKATFLRNYRLDFKSPFPQKVLINEIIWDTLESINKLKKNQSCIIPVGWQEHAVTVEITCVDLDLLTGTRKYQYKIFNTGEGRENHHLLYNKYHFHPLVYSELPESAFTFSFIHDLWFTDMYENMNEFYDLHDYHLLVASKGVKYLQKDFFYPRQRFGTCAYASLEAWIYSYLTEVQKHHIDKIKVGTAIQKQREIVKFNNLKEKKIPESRKRKATESCQDTKAKKFKESKSLLKFGEQIYKDLSKDKNLKKSFRLYQNL